MMMTRVQAETRLTSTDSRRNQTKSQLSGLRPHPRATSSWHEGAFHRPKNQGPKSLQRQALKSQLNCGATHPWTISSVRCRDPHLVGRHARGQAAGLTKKKCQVNSGVPIWESPPTRTKSRAES